LPGSIHSKLRERIEQGPDLGSKYKEQVTKIRVKSKYGTIAACQIPQEDLTAIVLLAICKQVTLNQSSKQTKPFHEALVGCVVVTESLAQPADSGRTNDCEEKCAQDFKMLWLH